MGYFHKHLLFSKSPMMIIKYIDITHLFHNWDPKYLPDKCKYKYLRPH